MKSNDNNLNDNYITLYNKDTIIYANNKCWNGAKYLCLKSVKINKGNLILISPYTPNFKALFNDFDSVKSLVTNNTCAIMIEPVQGEGLIYSHFF